MVAFHLNAMMPRMNTILAKSVARVAIYPVLPPGMDKAAEYRALAVIARDEARLEPLSRRRELHLAAAKRWEILAREVERTDRLLFNRGARGRQDWIM